MDIQKIHNPYDYRNPVREATLFAGRRAEIAEIAYELEQADRRRPTSFIALHGQRAAGKTSLLNKTEMIARDLGLFPVRIDLIPGDATPTLFYRKLYEEIIAEVDTRGELGDSDLIKPAKVRRILAGEEPGSGFPLEFPEALSLAAAGSFPEVALRADLNYFVQVLGRPLILLIDEAQLGAGHEDILSILRSLGPRLTGFIFILAGTPSLIERITDIFSPLLRQFKEIKVERFIEYSDVAQCVALPLAEAGLDVSLFTDFQGTVYELMALTDGNPYEIQLYCHEMFARWQRGQASNMALTTGILEDVQVQLESGRNVLGRPLIRSVRAMSTKRLDAFNVLCSSLGHATLDQIWFAHALIGSPIVDKATIERCREEFITAGIIEDSDIVRLAGETELFDEAYIRAWTINKSASRQYPQLMGRSSFGTLLSRRLIFLLGEISDAEMLDTCCPAMHQSHLDAGLAALDYLASRSEASVPFTIEYLHRAILAMGLPSSIDITTVTCTYERSRAVRWLYSSAADDFHLSAVPNFIEAAQRVAALGGDLRAERTRVSLKPWQEIIAWLLNSSTGDLRMGLAHNHSHAFYDAYYAGDLTGAQGHLGLAYGLHPTWEHANNLSYIFLATEDPVVASDWASKALELAQDPWSKALTGYNAALAQLLLGDLNSAGDFLSQALADLPTDARAAHLLIPRINGQNITLREKSEADLAEAIHHALLFSTPKVSSPKVPAVEPRVMQSSKSKTVLVVATEWRSAHGGLSTFNRDLCRALVAAGAKVYCLVLAATADEVAEAEGQGVDLLAAPAVPGAPEYTQLTRRPNLPQGTIPDFVIGHSRITGPAAQLLVTDFFTTARRLHFVHMAPDEIEWHKLDRDTDAALRAEQRTELERQLSESAYRVVTVGPRLHSRFLNELSDSASLPPIRVDPGFDTTDLTPRTPPAGAPLKVLLVGRTEDAELKGLDLAARACGQVAIWREKAALTRISLIVRGAPEGSADEQRGKLVVWAANPKLEIVVRPYSTEENRLAADMNRASLVIMPSRSEGFGLVGLEAITLGVPLLVSAESGLAELLVETLGNESAGRLIVPMSGDDDEDASAWARAIEAIMRDRAASFQRAAETRALLAEKVTWAAAAAVLLGELPTDGIL